MKKKKKVLRSFQEGRLNLLDGLVIYRRVSGCREKVVVNASKTNIILQGQGYLTTAIAWNDTANSTGGTIYSSSVAVFADNFTAYNISFQVVPGRH